METIYTYDALSTRLTEIVTSDGTQQQNTIQARSFEYSPAGDIEYIYDGRGGLITYEYTYDANKKAILCKKVQEP